VGVDSPEYPITLYRHGILSFQKWGDRYAVVQEGQALLTRWRSIDEEVRHAFEWMQFASSVRETSPVITVAKFIREYVGEERWALEILSNL